MKKQIFQNCLDALPASECQSEEGKLVTSEGKLNYWSCIKGLTYRLNLILIIKYKLTLHMRLYVQCIAIAKLHSQAKISNSNNNVDPE